MSAGSNIFIGCAGWSLASSVGSAFAAEGSHLERYASVLNAVEINSSFYRPHRPATYARWRDSVPDAFRFSVKIPRTVSHDCRLREAGSLIEQFLKEAGQLAEKLGCLLLQLPPSLVFSGADATTFFRQLREQTDVAVACEPRHMSWCTDEAGEILRACQIGFVDADPSPVANLTQSLRADPVYLRLHGSPVIYRSSYDDQFLADVAGQIATAKSEGREVWCVFDNTTEAAAIPNALTLMRLLGLDKACAYGDSIEGEVCTPKNCLTACPVALTSV